MRFYKANSNVANEWKDKKKKSKDEALLQESFRERSQCNLFIK